MMVSPMSFTSAENSRPVQAPTRMPPKKTRRKCQLASATDMGPSVPVAMARNTLKMTMAVASLNRLSPSIRMARRSATPIWRSKATTATGSVADSSAPLSSAAIQGKPVGWPMPKYIAVAVIRVDNSIRGIARNSMGSRFFHSSAALML